MLVLISVLCSGKILAQQDYPWLRTGDELYRRQSFTDAETAYRKAQEAKEKPTTSFNLGNSIYHQNRLPEAIQHYQEAIGAANDPALKAKAWYNLGNAQYQSQDFEKSVQAYKESLKLQPEDEDAKKNLMLAMRQYQQQQQQQQQNQDNKDQENKDQQQQQQQQQQNQDQQNKEQQEKSSSKDQSNAGQGQEEPTDKVSHDEAKEILKTIEREDQRVQEKLKKVSGKAAPPVKDW